MTELNKENICIGESSSAAFSQAFCETDIIVPDINPDISKVLQTDANAAIINKKCENGRIAVDGRADIVILYLGDDKNVYSINSSQQFSHIIDSPETTDNMYPETEIDIENVDFTVLNPRKVNVKVLMGIDANSVSDANVCLCTSLSADEPYEVLVKTINPYKTAGRATEQICIKERLEIPNGKPSADRILRVDASIKDKKCSTAENKVIVDGILCVSTVYLSDIDGKIQIAEHEVPFTEVISVNGTDESMDCCAKLCINKVYYKPEEDVDGDKRFIMLECIITANVKACYGYQIDIIEDAYCTNHPVKINRESTGVNKLALENSTQISSKDVVTIDAENPEIAQIFNIIPHAYVGTSKIENGVVTIDGIIESDIMYISEDESSPLNTYRHQQKFSYSTDVPEGNGDMICDVSIDIIHSSYTITLGREIDLRFVLEVNVKVLSEEKINYITGIEKDEEQIENPSKSYCIKIYFVKEGDDLWNIAKKYRVKKDVLMEINNINADSDRFDGRQIMIPIK